MVDGNRPVVAGYIPVKLVVVGKESRAVVNCVLNLDRANRVDRVRDVNLQIAEPFRGLAFILQLLTTAIRNTINVKKQRVIGSVRTGIVDGNRAMNTVPLAEEDKLDALLNHSASFFSDNDRVLVVGNTPAFRERRESEKRKK